MDHVVNPYLQFVNVSKSFPGVRALDHVSFGVREGHAHALVGENGAGKSTLLKILGGAIAPSGGHVRLAGQERLFASTADAIKAGVAIIHQELQLVPDLTVAENLFLGHLPNRWGFLDRRRLREKTIHLLRQMEMQIPPSARVRRLSAAQRQMVEIMKALALGAKIIAFDEPTSSLSARETHQLFHVIRGLKQAGHVILYVSHRLEEISAICDSATVLRDGRHVETFESLQGVTHDMLVGRMIGREIEDIYGYRPRPHGKPALEAVNVMGPGLAEPASLAVAQGEIVGIFGLIGAGRSELVRLLYGAAPLRGGTIRVDGRPVAVRSPRDAIRAGVMLCPEDRKEQGIIPVRSVQENINLSARRNRLRLGMWINERWERANAREKIARLGISASSPRQATVSLSGGNQQKTILARWLSEDMRVILLDEPTRGIDVGAKSEVYSIIFDLARRGIGVVAVSSELPEVLGISDRVLVMRQGRISGSLPRESATEAEVLRLALPAGEALRGLEG